MNKTAIPSKVPQPWATNAPTGNVNVIPATSQIGTIAGAASWPDGFPPLTATNPSAGGVPPSIGDENGVLKILSAWVQWQAAGGPVFYDSAFSSIIGGYPAGAVLASTTPGNIWVNLVDGNTTNPDLGGSNWQPIGAGLLKASNVVAPYNTQSSQGVSIGPSYSGTIQHSFTAPSNGTVFATSYLNLEFAALSPIEEQLYIISSGNTYGSSDITALSQSHLATGAVSAGSTVSVSCTVFASVGTTATTPATYGFGYTFTPSS